VIVSVTALGSRRGAATAATAIVAYLDGRGRERGGRSPSVDAHDDKRGPGGYYADSVEGAGLWFGHGVGSAWRSGSVDATEFERLLLGQDPATGRPLVVRRDGQAGSTPMSPTGQPDELLTASDAGALLGMPARLVRRAAQRSRNWVEQAAEAEAAGRTTPVRPASFLIGERGDGRRDPWLFRRDEVERFGRQRERRAATVGFDVTFSAPKSVSVLWAVADPTVEAAILDSVHAAVATGMRYLEQQAIACRVGGRVVQGDGLLAAGFLHATNRNLDPQLHWHVVVGNLTGEPGGSVRALDGRQLFLHAKTAGFLASAELRHQLTARLGVAWGEVVHGVAEIVGVPEAAIRLASSRAVEIDRLTGELGLGGPAARQVAAYQTRPTKDTAVDPVVLRGRWRDQLGEVGFTADYVAQRVWGRRATVPDVDGGTVARWYRRLGSARGVTEQSATFDRRHVIQRVAALAGDRLAAVTIEDVADAWLASSGVQALADRPGGKRSGPVIVRRDGRTVRTPTGMTVYSTPELLELEYGVLSAVEAGFGTGRAVVNPATVAGVIVEQERVTGRRLGADQAAMVLAACTAGDAVQCVVGPAGSGKTFALAAAARAWERAGCVVWGAAVNGIAAEQLARTTGIRAWTVASLLRRLDVADTAGLSDRHVIIVDEASTVGSRDLARLLGHTGAAGAAVRLVGDPAQHSAVDAGGLFRGLVHRHPDRTPTLTVLRRQASDGMADIRSALTAYRHGRIADAWRVLSAGDRVVTATSPGGLLDRLCADWYADRRRHLADPTGVARSSMVAENHVERRALNNRARAMLRADGTLSGDEVNVAGQRFAVGDDVICRTPARHLHPPGDPTAYVRNGTRGTITAVAVDGQQPTVTVDFDRRGPIQVPFEFLIRVLRPGAVGGLTHAYALTSHAAQGETYDAGRMLATEEATRPGVYVGLSRGTTDARLYVVRADDVHPPREPDDVLPVLRDQTRAADALARRLQSSAPERLATDHDRDALAVARLRHRHDLTTLDQLAATGDPIARQAALATATAIAEAAILRPQRGVVAALGRRPDDPIRRAVWDRAVGGLAVHWNRAGDGPTLTETDGLLSTGDDAHLSTLLHNAAVAHLAATRTPAALTGELRDLEQRLTGVPSGRDLALIEARLDGAARAGQAVDTLTVDVETVRRQVTAADPDRRRARRLDDALGAQIRAAIEQPAGYLIALFGPPHHADDIDRWQRHAAPIERYRHRYLGLSPADGPLPDHGGDARLAAVGPRPADRHAGYAWVEATRTLDIGHDLRRER
jgi:conjugative relaxase-like TrwC/TraI family protein